MEALAQIFSPPPPPLPPPPPPPPPRHNLKPVAHGLMVSFDRQAGPIFGCALNQTIGSRVQWKAGLDNTVSTTPDVVTGSHQLSKFEIVVATFPVYHWWLNKPCSYSTFATVFLTALDFRSLNPTPQSWQQISFCCFNIFIDLFLHHKLKNTCSMK